MASQNNYIGVAMGLDVTDLKAGLSEANKRIQEANSEFKRASSGMEDWTKSTEGLNAKIKQLDTVLGAQKSKLAGLEAEYNNLDKTSANYEEQARKLRIQINNQKAVVNATEKELENYKDTLKKAKDGTIDLERVSLRAGKAVDQVGDGAEEGGKNLDGLKGVAKGVGGVLVGLASAVAGVVTSFFSLAESTREYREDLSKLGAAFKGSGLSAESAKSTYMDLYKVIGETDTAVEASQQIALLANSEKEAAQWAELASGVVGTFGDALKAETFYEAANETMKLGEATGAYVQMLEGTGMSVDAFNAGLQACTTEEEKQAYMLQISEQALGKAGEAYNELNKDVLNAQEAQAKLTDVMAELGAIAEPIMTTLKLLVVDLLEAIKPFVELVGEGLKGAFEGSADSASILAEGITGILNTLLDKAVKLLPLIIDVILELIPKIINAILDALPQILDLLLSLISQIIVALGEMLPQIVSKIIEIIPLLIESLMNAIPQLIDAAITFLMAIVQAIPSLIDQILVALPQVIETIINGLITAIPQLLQSAIQLLNAILDAIPVIIQSLITNLPKIINTIIDGLLDALPMLLEAAITLLMAIIDALPTIIKLLVKEIPKIVTTIVNTLIERLPDLIQGAIQLWMGIIEAIPTIITELVKNIPEIITTIVEGLGDGWEDLKEAGVNLLKGIWEGITGGAKWLKDKITGFAGDVAGWFKETFKINSPSKLMADEVGLFVGEGIGEGVLDSLPYVKKDLSKFSKYVTDNLGGIKAGLSVDGNYDGTVNGASKTTIVNTGMTVNYNGKLSRKQLKQLENDQYVAVKTKLRLEGAI